MCARQVCGLPGMLDFAGHPCPCARSFSPDESIRKQEGMIWSPDGVCRPFADAGTGTVVADGAGVVVLARSTALATRLCAQTYAVLEGVSVNNDGRRKAMFSQPSVAGQVEVTPTPAAH